MTGQVPVAPKDLYERLTQQLNGTSSLDAVDVLFGLFCQVAGSTLKGPELADSLVEKLIPDMKRRLAEAYNLARESGEVKPWKEFEKEDRVSFSKQYPENEIAAGILDLLRERNEEVPEAIMGCSRAISAVIVANANSVDSMHEMARMAFELIEEDIKSATRPAVRGVTIQ